jgi:hypothetical protein
MNNSGPLYIFLQDGFDVMGHPENPVCAFWGWRRHMVRTAEAAPKLLMSSVE